MYARLTITSLSSGEVDASADVFEQILPAVSELEGFEGMFVLSELDGRRIVALSLWATATALQQAQPVMDSLRDAETKFRQVEAQETTRFKVTGASPRKST
jgi:heme-degrading monooxygenase HmoA